jgi:hypothetical protein
MCRGPQADHGRSARLRPDVRCASNEGSIGVAVLAVQAVRAERPGRAPPRGNYTVGMPVFRVSDAALLPVLLEDLRKQNDCLAEAVGQNRLSVSVLGSFHSDAMRMEVELRIQAWQAAQRSRGVDVSVDLDQRG